MHDTASIGPQARRSWHGRAFFLAAMLAVLPPWARSETPDVDNAPPVSTDADINYRLGQGLRVPGTGLTLGGYSTASYRHEQDRTPSLSLDNFSLFVWWEGPARWKLFSELDEENLLSSRREAGDSESRRYLALERLYADYAVTETSSLRIGKFLTPIGRWNLIHATPLVWTTSRPLVTEHVFPTNATGLMFNGTVPVSVDGVEYSVYASNGQDIRPNPRIDTFKKAVGGHLKLPLTQDAQLGLSYASFEQEHSVQEHKRLAGVDFIWASQGYEFSAEGVYRYSDIGPNADEKGAFGQWVVPVVSRLYGVFRLEWFKQAGLPDATHILVGGLNFRYTPAVVFKVEWVRGSDVRSESPPGVLSSVSVLF